MGAIAFSAFGCNTVSAEKFQNTQRKLQLAEERVKVLEAESLEQQEKLDGLQAQVAELRGVDSGAIDDLVTVDAIRIVSPSGGYDEDGKPGDDGLVIYVQPIDREGHILKAAGSFKVRLIDLAQPADKLEIAAYHFDVPTTRSKWFGRMWTNHFTLKCPWPPQQTPQNREITAHVEFTELLTGKRFKTQQVFAMQLNRSAASSPSASAK